MMLATLDLATPALVVLAVVNAALVFRPGSHRMQRSVGVALAALSLWFLKDWVEGLLYLVLMP